MIASRCQMGSAGARRVQIAATERADTPHLLRGPQATSSPGARHPRRCLFLLRPASAAAHTVCPPHAMGCGQW